MESSCDETAAAIVENGRHIVSSVIFSQVDTHALYGGVVPEIASRAHMDACDRVIDRALQEAGMALSDVDALAVTYGPGLVGALLTGIVMYRTQKRWGLNITSDDLMMVVFGVVFGLIIGARLFYVVFYGDGFYLEHPLEIFMTNHGA